MPDFIREGQAPNSASHDSDPVFDDEAPSLGQKQASRKYGKGFSILSKMGYSGGGLGKHGQGRGTPIQVSVRRKGEGLQAGGNSFTASPFLRDLDDNDPLFDGLTTGRRHRRKKPNPTLMDDDDDFITRMDIPATSFNPLAHVLDQKHKSHIDRSSLPMRVAEVLMTEAHSRSLTLASLDMDVDRLQNDLLTLQHQLDSLTDLVQSEDELLGHARIVHLALDKMHSVIQERTGRKVETESDMELDDDQPIRIGKKDPTDCTDLVLGACTAIGSISSACGKEAMRKLQVAQIIVALLDPVYSTTMASWNISNNDRLAKASTKLLGVLAQYWDGVGLSSKSLRTPTLADLFARHVVPKLMSHTGTMWDPKDPLPMYRVLESWSPAFPEELTRRVLRESVVPVILKAVGGWTPFEPLPMETWVGPWTNFKDQAITYIFSFVRSRLESFINVVDLLSCPVYDSAGPPMNIGQINFTKILISWRRYMDPGNWEIIRRTCITKLSQSLSMLQINPGNQQIQPMYNLFAWREVIDDDGVVLVLNNAFFKRWLQVLYMWLGTPGVKMEEVVGWYKGWTSIFPETLQNHPSVETQLRNALAIMQSYMGGGVATSPDGPLVVTPRSTPVIATSRATHVEGLKDLLTVKAEEANVSLVPTKRSVRGNTIYKLGTSSVVLDGGVVYKVIQQDCEPVDLDTLILYEKTMKENKDRIE